MASPATASVAEPSARTHLLAAALIAVGFAGQAIRNLVGWPGFAIVCLVLVVAAVRVIVAHGRFARILPPALLAFLAVSAASVIWTEYHWVTLLGVVIQLATTAGGVAVALLLDRAALLRVLATTLSALVGLSLLFEAFVTFVVGHRFAPFFTERRGDLPGAFYWSENHLLEGGPIQGIMGNRNLLAFVALLAVVTVLLAAWQRGRLSRLDMASLAASALALALTRSATVVVALAAVGAVAVLAILFRRVPRERRVATVALFVMFGACVAVWLQQHSHFVLGLLGRSDLTNRVDVWRTVASIAEKHPWLGLGWTGYWAPWAKPFHDLIVIDGVQYLQAHNALLDIWLQLGVIGVAAALCLVATLTWTSARTAVYAAREDLPAALAPLLLLTALLVQSLTESRLLIEGNWMLLTMIASTLALSPVVGRVRSSAPVPLTADVRAARSTSRI